MLNLKSNLILEGSVCMVGRNDRCPCGSGKKYKKCCESKNAVVVADVHADELERVLQSFYEEYPERKDIPEFIELANEWKSTLKSFLAEEMIEAIVLDEFFFHRRVDIWTGFLEKQRKKQVRPSVLQALKEWQKPRLFIGEVTEVEVDYMIVKSILDDELIHLQRESDKPVSPGAYLNCFLLPDGTFKEQHYLAVSSLIFFPIDHKDLFESLEKEFNEQNSISSTEFVKQNSLTFWERLGTDGYEGGEFTEFEAGVLLNVMEFLDKHNRESFRLLELVEDYLVEQQPSARKDVAIAAGAIRFGLENNYFSPLDSNLKEIAEWFGVSTSSMLKYSKELQAYQTATLEK